MKKILNIQRAVSLAEGYFEMLKKTGYVKEHTSCLLALFYFLTDFAETLYPFLTNEDWKRINALSAEIFSEGDCLLGYPVTCTEKIIAGMPYKMDAESIREIGEGSTLVIKKTQEENIKRM